MKGLGGLMKQAQQMQANMAKMQEEIAQLEISGSAGGDLVTVQMTGKYQIRNITIDDSLVGEDKDMLEDLVAAAVNDAVNKVADTTKERYSELTGGIDLPGGMQMPF